MMAKTLLRAVFNYLSLNYKIERMQESFGFSLRSLLIIYIILSSYGCKCDASIVFDIHPSSTNVEEGKNVTLQCQIRSDVNTATSFWETSKREIVYPQELIHVDTHFNNGLITSNWTIQRALRDLDGAYRCTFLLLEGDRITMASSDFGELGVLHFPGEGELICDTQDDLAVAVGSTVTVSCEVPGCNLPLDMTWEQSNRRALHHTVLSQEVCSLSWMVTIDRRLQGEMIHCVVTNSNFPGRRSNCSLGPYEVLYQPKVEVSPRYSEILVPSLTRSISLQCLVDANPLVNVFRWSCLPEGALSACGSTEQNISIPLAQVGLRNLSVDVTCTAINTIGTSDNTSKIIFGSPLINYSGNECSSRNQHGVADIDTGIYLFHSRIKGVYHFTCAFIDSNETSLFFTWYLDGVLVQKSNNSNVKYTLSWLKRDFFVLPNNSPSGRGPHVVTCEINNGASVKGKSCTFTSNVDPATTGSPMKTSSQESTKAADSSFDFWDIFWMLLIAVSVGFVLVMCSISLVLIIQRATRQGRLPFNRHPDTVQLSNLQQGIFPNPKCGNSDEPVYEQPRNCTVRRKSSAKPLLPRPKQDVCELKKLKDDVDPEGSCSDGYSGVYEDSSQGTDNNSTSLVSSSETSSATQYQEYAECDREDDFIHYDNQQMMESFIGDRQSSYYWNKSLAFKEFYDGSVEDKVKMFASEGSLRNIQRIYLE